MRTIPISVNALIVFGLGILILIIVVWVGQRMYRRSRRTQWEYSEIQWLSPEVTKGLFYADTSDAKGKPVRISSRVITLYSLLPDRHNPDHVRALDGVIKGLEANGWQLLDQPGKAWYAYRFRRATR